MAGPAVPIRAYARIRGHQAAPVPARNSIKILTRRNGGPRRARGSRSADGGTSSPWSSVVLRVKSFLCCPRARHCQVPTGCRSSAHSNFYSPHALRLLQLDQAAADFSPALDHDLDIGRVAPAHRARHRRRVLHETRQHLQPRQKPADGTFPLDRKGERSMHQFALAPTSAGRCSPRSARAHSPERPAVAVRPRRPAYSRLASRSRKTACTCTSVPTRRPRGGYPIPAGTARRRRRPMPAPGRFSRHRSPSFPA